MSAYILTHLILPIMLWVIDYYLWKLTDDKTDAGERSSSFRPMSSAITSLPSKDLLSSLHGDDDVKKKKIWIIICQGPSWLARPQWGGSAWWRDRWKGACAPPHPNKMMFPELK